METTNKQINKVEAQQPQPQPQLTNEEQIERLKAIIGNRVIMLEQLIKDGAEYSKIKEDMLKTLITEQNFHLENAIKSLTTVEAKKIN